MLYTLFATAVNFALVLGYNSRMPTDIVHVLQSEIHIDESKPIKQFVVDASVSLPYFHLRNNLRIRQGALNNVMIKYPWLLYLKADTNMRPTVMSCFISSPPRLNIFFQTNHRLTLIDHLVSQLPTFVPWSREFRAFSPSTTNLQFQRN